MVARVLAGVRVWDGVSQETSAQPLHIRIEEGRIAAIGAGSELLGDARVVEFGSDAVALPGLCDAHVHMTLDPAIRSPADQIKLPAEEVVRGMEQRALEMARAGITTARDLGGGAWLELALRDRIAAGELPGPRLLCAGQPITTRKGHCHFWGGCVSSADPIRSVVQRQIEHGSDCIKVMATGGVVTPGTSIRDAQFSAEELGELREEAARHGRQVAAHCHGTAGIRNAVEAQLRTIEHCSFAGDKGFGSDLDPSLLERIAGQETWISPTINAGWRRFLEKKNGEPTRFLKDMRQVYRRSRSAGARLVASTDAGIPNVHHRDLPRALEVMRIFTELEPVEVLRCATSEAARALELERETGKLEPGLAADILVVRGDPLRDLGVLERPQLVLCRGELVN